MVATPAPSTDPQPLVYPSGDFNPPPAPKAPTPPAPPGLTDGFQADLDTMTGYVTTLLGASTTLGSLSKQLKALVAEMKADPGAFDSNDDASTLTGQMDDQSTSLANLVTGVNDLITNLYAAVGLYGGAESDMSTAFAEVVQEMQTNINIQS